MEIWLIIIAIIISIIGIIGCFAPILPGPPLSYLALILMYYFGEADISGTYMIVLLVMTVIVTVLDYLVPAYVTKKTGGNNASAKGALVGTIAGIFIPFIGMILGAFLGALLTEIFVNGKSLKDSLKPAAGTFIGFLLGTGLKLMLSIIMLIKLIMVIW